MLQNKLHVFVSCFTPPLTAAWSSNCSLYGVGYAIVLAILKMTRYSRFNTRATNPVVFMNLIPFSWYAWSYFFDFLFGFDPLWKSLPVNLSFVFTFFTPQFCTTAQLPCNTSLRRLRDVFVIIGKINKLACSKRRHSSINCLWGQWRWRHSFVRPNNPFRGHRLGACLKYLSSLFSLGFTRLRAWFQPRGIF